MNVEVIEHEDCFAIELTPENLAEAALLVRMGMNHKQEIRYFSTSAKKDGTFSTDLVFPKSKRSDSAIPKRR